MGRVLPFVGLATGHDLGSGLDLGSGRPGKKRNPEFSHRKLLAAISTNHARGRHATAAQDRRSFFRICRHEKENGIVSRGPWSINPQTIPGHWLAGRRAGLRLFNRPERDHSRWRLADMKITLRIPALFLPGMALLLGGMVRGEEAPRYLEKQPSRDGIGKVYMGREISQTVSVHAISWLERRDRESEEQPSLVIENLDLAPDAVVADIGAGSGYFSFLLAPRVPEGKVIALDVQQKMLDFVEGQKKLRRVSNVETHLGTIEDTRLPEKTVDLAILVDAYHEFSHPYEMMSSIVRGLKPGGRVLLLEYRGEDPLVPIKPLHKMTVKQVKREMAAVGLEFVERKDILPIQHYLVFQRPIDS